MLLEYRLLFYLSLLFEIKLIIFIIAADVVCKSRAKNEQRDENNVVYGYVLNFL